MHSRNGSAFASDGIPSRLVLVALAALIGGFWSSSAMAEGLGASTRPATTGAVDGPPATPSTSTEVFRERMTVLEGDLSTLLQRRADASGAALSIINFQTDMRIVQHWLLAKALGEEADSPVQTCVALRVATLQSVGVQLSQQLQNSTGALTPTQLEGLKRLHELTYALPDIASPATIDETCKTLVTSFILIANPDPNPIDVKTLPQMRPQPFAVEAAGSANAPRTLADLTAVAQAVEVSSGLKRQLLALASAATAASADQKTQDEASNLYDMLAESLEVAQGLAQNTAIDAVSRPKIEQQLTDGIVLYSDVRTRGAGRQRLTDLGQYRQTISVLRGLKISPAILPKLSPAMIWVNNNPESGGKVLETIQNYLKLCSRFDALRDPPGLTPPLRRAVEALEKQFSAQRSGFLDDAADLGGGGAGVMSTSPATLANHIDVMQPILDYLLLVEKLPRAIQVLAAYKLRPTGALERRTAAAATEVSAGPLSSTRDTAAAYLANVERLAKLVEALSPPPGIAPAILTAYMHGRLEAVGARRNAVVADLASALATGKDMDPSDFSKLDTLRMMFDSLRLSNDVELGLSKASLLARWVDWSISAAQLKALVLPYRDATAAAFDGFADDNSTPISRWPDVQARFLPILELTKQVGLYADQCKDFPTGFVGDLAKLLTPMDNQPFGAERYASLAVAVWQRAAESPDPKVPDAVFDAMLTRLGKALNLTPATPTTQPAR